MLLPPGAAGGVAGRVPRTAGRAWHVVAKEARCRPLTLLDCSAERLEAREPLVGVRACGKPTAHRQPSRGGCGRRSGPTVLVRAQTTDSASFEIADSDFEIPNSDAANFPSLPTRRPLSCASPGAGRAGRRPLHTHVVVPARAAGPVSRGARDGVVARVFTPRRYGAEVTGG